MAVYQIFADPKLDAQASQVLREGVSPGKIIIPAKLAPSVLSAGEPDPAFDGADIAFGQPVLENIYRSKKLKWVHLSTAGFTRYDTDEFREHAKKTGLIVTNSSGVYAEACAEHVFAFMLAQSRRLPYSLSLRVPNGHPQWVALRDSYKPLRGQKVLILGFGGIALRLVKMLAPFEMEIVAMRRTPRGDEGVTVVTPDRLAESMATADHVINILPDNPESVGFFNAERFASMKAGAVFYNIGRGTTVDQGDLFKALKFGQLEAAWLDVTSPEPLPDGHPLWNLPNCHITPHTAGGHHHESLTLVKHFLSNFDRYVKGEPLIDRVM